MGDVGCSRRVECIQSFGSRVYIQGCLGLEVSMREGMSVGSVHGVVLSESSLVSWPWVL